MKNYAYEMVEEGRSEESSSHIEESQPRTIRAGYVFIALQIIMYIISIWLVNPRGSLEPHPLALLRIGSMGGEYVHCNVLELRRFFVPIFLHGGIAHLAMNIVFQLTSLLEVEVGSRKFIQIFLLSGVTGNLLTGAITPGISSIGASTACYGMLGAQYMREWIIWPELSEEEKKHVKSRLSNQTAMLILWEVFNWNTISHFGHLGGFVGGFILYSDTFKGRFLLAVLATVCIVRMLIFTTSSCNLY